MYKLLGLLTDKIWLSMLLKTKQLYMAWFSQHCP